MCGFIYIDGSETKVNSETYTHGYGYSGSLKGAVVEGFGYKTIPKNQKGTHELFAFQRSLVELLSEFTLKEVLGIRFYVDTDIVLQGLKGCLPDAPFNRHTAPALVQLQLINGLAPSIWDVIEHGNVYLIKGHQGHAHQERADYLASNYKRTDFLDFDTWLTQGIKKWNTEKMVLETLPYPFVPVRELTEALL